MIKFTVRLKVMVLDYPVYLYKKLLLTCINLENDVRNENKFNIPSFFERSNFGVIFENFKEAFRMIPEAY